MKRTKISGKKITNAVIYLAILAAELVFAARFIEQFAIANPGTEGFYNLLLIMVIAAPVVLIIPLIGVFVLGWKITE